MKDKADLVRGWVRKARSDLLAMAASRQAGALDACCFHAQQATEKLLKAYLIEKDIEFPFTHNLARLIGLAAETDAAFDGLSHAGQALTPYAVQLRYDEEFWPTEETAREACDLAHAAESFIVCRLSTDLGGPQAGERPAR